MQIIKNQKEANEWVREHTKNGQTCGFVPTMGALHDGHISLITKAKSENDWVVASIFVNPTQFNDPKDLINYPKTPELDHAALENSGCDMLFEPDVAEVYDNSYVFPTFDFGGLDQTMEGAHRPGHFNGVAMVVYKLFNIIPAQRSYFGEKDFQQLAIIRKMTNDFGIPTTIIPCPTMREHDGMAMSSRNIRLTPEERKAAPILFKSMVACKDLIDKYGLEKALQLTKEGIELSGVFKVEYVEIMNPDTLHPVTTTIEPGRSRIFLAVKASNTRLIDNLCL